MHHVELYSVDLILLTSLGRVRSTHLYADCCPGKPTAMLNSKLAVNMIAGTALSALLLLLAATYALVHLPQQSQLQFSEMLFGIAFVSLLVISALLVHFLSRSQTSSNRLRVQLALTSALAESQNLDATVERVLESLCKLSGWKVGTFWVLKEATEADSSTRFYFECRNTWQEPSFRSHAFAEACKNNRLNSDQGLPGQVLRAGRPMWSSDIVNEPYFVRAKVAKQVGIRTALAFPVKCGAQTCGILELFSDESRPADHTLIDLVAAFGSQIGQFFQREQATELAKLNETRFKQLAENIEDVFWISGPRGIPFHYVSPAYERIWGRDVEELYRDSHAWLKYVFEEDLEALLPIMEREAPPPIMEYRIRRPDGSVRWMWGRNFPVLNELGETRFCGIMQDVTERRESERRVREFYSTVSHELRTPLTSIKASLGLVTHGIAGDIPEEAQQLLQIASAECDRLVRLINDILDLRKIEAGKLELKIKTVSPSDLITQAVNSIRATADNRDIEFSVSLHPNCEVECDPDRVLQVLANLLSNAIKYSPDGGTIDVGVLRKPGNVLRFFVSDTGPGIQTEDLPKLFGKFQQLDSSDARPREGSGLGLAISKAIVEQHGGKMGVDTKYGEGSTFWFEFCGAQAPSDPSLSETLTLHALP